LEKVLVTEKGQCELIYRGCYDKHLPIIVFGFILKDFDGSDYVPLRVVHVEVEIGSFRMAIVADQAQRDWMVVEGGARVPYNRFSWSRARLIAEANTVRKFTLILRKGGRVLPFVNVPIYLLSCPLQSFFHIAISTARL